MKQYIINIDPITAIIMNLQYSWTINNSNNVLYFVSVIDTDESIQGTTKSKKNYT